MSTSIDTFGEFASHYEKGVGAATRHIAKVLVNRSPAITKDSIILDNATGTGIVLEELQNHLTTSAASTNLKVKTIATDAALPMVNVLRAKVESQPPRFPNLDIVTKIVTAEKLDEEAVASNSITHSYTNFGLFFCLGFDQAAQQIYRSLAPGGTAFVTCWNDFGYEMAIRRAEKRLDPNSTKAEFKFPWGDLWKDPTYQKEVMVKAGFETSKVEAFQEDSFLVAETAQEMAKGLSEFAVQLVRGDAGWSSEEERLKWIELVGDELQEDERLVPRAEQFCMRMKANIAVCRK